MKRTSRACWVLLAALGGASVSNAEMVIRRWGTAPKAPPGRRKVRAVRTRPPTAYVAETTSAPSIDGRLTDRAWAKAAKISLARTLDGTHTAAQPTEVMLCHDARMLYLAFRCAEPDVGKVRASRRRHDGEVWSDESVEFFLGAGGVYYHFGVNAAGATYDGRMKDGSWNSGIKAAAARGARQWSVEAAVSLEKIGAKEGGELIANFNRNRWVTGSLQESAWSPTYSGDSHVPARFGRLLFKAPPKAIAPRQPDKPVVSKGAVKILPCAGGEAVVRFDLSDLPRNARIHRADLLVFRTSRITGMDEDARTDILIHPLFRPFKAGDRVPVGARRPLLKLRPPWYDRFDATEAVRRWASGKPNGGFFVRACPRFDAEAACLDIAYEGRPRKVPPQVTGLKAFHRAGQTFVTWREIEDLVGRDAVKWGELKSILDSLDRNRRVRYVVYRSPRPITAETLHQARRIAAVKPLSCWNVNGRSIERAIEEVIASKYALLVGHGNPFGRARPDGAYGLDSPLDRLVIRDGARGPDRGGPRSETSKPLPRGTGLYVHTAGKAGKAHYAVVTSINGVQNTRDFSAANSLARPVAETAGRGEPVLQGELPKSPLWSYPGRRMHYVRWVAPPLVNLPSQYYNWSAAFPEKLTGRAPLELCFHRDNGSYWRTHYRIERDSIVLCPHDFPMQTWWYGYHESLGTLKSFGQGRIHNYTERRLLAFLEWAINKCRVDRNRIIVTGTAYSGGSGALHLGLRHPEVFSLVCTGHGIPDYASAIRNTANTRRKGMLDSLQRVCGRLEWNLKTDTGQSVWDELNLTRTVAGRPAGADLPMVAMSAQHYVAWGLWPAYSEFFKVMLQKRHPIVASFSWYGARIVGVSRTATFPGAIRLDVARNRSMLAVKGPGTAVLDKPGGGMGGFNAAFRWRDIVDRPDRYEVSLFLAGRADKVSTPVTLRRLGRFKVEPGKACAWVNRSLDGKTILQQGDAAAGDDGLLTIEGVEFHRRGSRLVVTPK